MLSVHSVPLHFRRDHTQIFDQHHHLVIKKGGRGGEGLDQISTDWYTIPLLLFVVCCCVRSVCVCVCVCVCECLFVCVCGGRPGGVGVFLGVIRVILGKPSAMYIETKQHHT